MEKVGVIPENVATGESMSEKPCSCCEGCEGQDRFRAELQKLAGTKGALVSALQLAQRMHGYVSEDAMKAISDALGEPMSNVYGVVTFYSFFSLKPRGRYLVRVCLGTACYVLGANEVLEELKKVLGVPVGGTTQDSLFTLDAGRCFGACGLAPVIMVSDTVHQRVAVKDVKGIIEQYRAEAASKSGGESAAQSVVTGESAKAEIPPVTSIDNFHSLVADVQGREAALRKANKESVLVCAGGGCIASGALKIVECLQISLKSHGLADRVGIVQTGCLGPCSGGPVLVIGRDKTFYQRVTEADVEEIVAGHLVGGKVIERLTWKEGGVPVPVMTDLNYFKRQTKVVLRNCGIVEPTRLTDYLVRDGFKALAKVLGTMTPENVLREMEISALRGRGGAGFPTYLKWTFTRNSHSDTKYILCNADEGDPGAYMDRSVLEGDPFSVIEGMAIGAFVIGAKQGYVYVRAEYPLAVERLQIAIEKARQAGLLGHNILGTGFSFDLEIRMGSGAFVCGEETALINSIEGKRGEPRSRPPFPAVKGLWQQPSCLNNVETFANVPAIILNGGLWFASYGIDNNRGTKVFALAGAIVNSGLVEVPIGTSLREVVFGIGGGIPNGRSFKAAQMGGPSGGCVTEKHLDTSLDYESLQKLGAIMGSGGLIVMDETSCMVDVARFFLEFTQDESCGKCVPCREGTKRMLDILERICHGKGEEGDVERLQALGETIKGASLCGLGQTAPNPVLSTIANFRDEYDEHIREKKCRAHVCTALKRYTINEKCVGCTACAKACPVACIAGAKKERHMIDQAKCIKCGKCFSVCKFKAIDLG
jgi:NADP-reducing hydrogenase subunit HndC